MHCNKNLWKRKKYSNKKEKEKSEMRKEKEVFWDICIMCVCVKERNWLIENKGKQIMKRKL